jgi:hypothetical protein
LVKGLDISNIAKREAVAKATVKNNDTPRSEATHVAEANNQKIKAGILNIGKNNPIRDPKNSMAVIFMK